jgi:alpha-beta hydrolase superfamily lysophospholipase
MVISLKQIVKMILVPLCLTLPLSAMAEISSSNIGIVIMHGKGGSPKKFVAELASSLENRGYLVANLEMPWSGRRDYDVNVAVAEQEVEAALSSLRERGAMKLFVAGHSQGGLFALYFGNKHVVDGVVAIAPGGNVASQLFRDKLGESVALAKKLVAEGKGEEKSSLSDFESSKGAYPVVSPPAAYLTWFDPEGAMNEAKAVRNVNPAIPVLFIAPTNDYPGLRKIKQEMFDALPRNPHSKLYEPGASHIQAPSASIGEIVEWSTAVANSHQEGAD